MLRTVVTVAAIAGLGSAARADDVYEVCKGESKHVVTGAGRQSIAVVYPDDFPVATTPAMRNKVGAKLATAEKAKIVPAKDVFAAQKLVAEKRWSDKVESCGHAPSLIAVLGQKHTNLSTAYASVVCDDKGGCTLQFDLERHGRPTAERWARYAAPLSGPKDKLETISKAAPKLKVGPATGRTSPGLAVTELPTGVVTMRSDVDGALEVDRTMEASATFAACRPAARKAKDIRGYWATWTLTALGRPSGVTVKPFAGDDPTDQQAAKCLAKAIETIQLACPRDNKPAPVKTAICL
jgi:hypothetical protein